MQQVLIHHNLANLKSDIHKLDIDQLKTTPVDLS